MTGYVKQSGVKYCDGLEKWRDVDHGAVKA